MIYTLQMFTGIYWQCTVRPSLFTCPLSDTSFHMRSHIKSSKGLAISQSNPLLVELISNDFELLNTNFSASFIQKILDLNIGLVS